MQAGWLDRLLGFRQHVGLMAQGLQRGLDPSGGVVPFTQPSSDLVVRPPPKKKEGEKNTSSCLLPVLCELQLPRSGASLSDWPHLMRGLRELSVWVGKISCGTSLAGLLLSVV